MELCHGKQRAAGENGFYMDKVTHNVDWVDKNSGLFSLMDAMEHRPPSGQREGGSLKLATAIFNIMFEESEFLVTTSNFCLKAIFFLSVQNNRQRRKNRRVGSKALSLVTW